MPAPKRLAEPPGTSRHRVAGFVNRNFGGNIRAAAEELGCTYELLYWPLKRGGTPSLRLLSVLARKTNTPLEYWTGKGKI